MSARPSPGPYCTGVSDEGVPYVDLGTHVSEGGRRTTYSRYVVFAAGDMEDLEGEDLATLDLFAASHGLLMRLIDLADAVRYGDAADVEQKLGEADVAIREARGF